MILGGNYEQCSHLICPSLKDGSIILCLSRTWIKLYGLKFSPIINKRSLKHYLDYLWRMTKYLSNRFSKRQLVIISNAGWFHNVLNIFLSIFHGSVISKIKGGNYFIMKIQFLNHSERFWRLQPLVVLRIRCPDSNVQQNE